MKNAECIREIYWRGKTYRPGDLIRITKEDAYVLYNAGVIGNVKNEVEFAVREAPENAMKTHRKRSKKWQEGI